MYFSSCAVYFARDSAPRIQSIASNLGVKHVTPIGAHHVRYVSATSGDSRGCIASWIKRGEVYDNTMRSKVDGL